MNIDDLIGYYTYRSFLDRPVGEPNDLLWGAGELLFLISDEGAIAGTLAFPAEAAAERKQIMDLAGTVTAWNPLSFRFIGKGRPRTAIADYEYEYDCRVAHEWDAATPAQRRSLVGTVRRNKDHGQTKAGATASFIAVQRDFVEPRDVRGFALIPEAVAMLADRAHRLRHTVWHTLRGDWYSPNTTDGDRERLGKLGWHLADPPFRPAGGLDLTNGAGEDFLYMHRRMIQMMRAVYAKAGKPYPASWTQIPSSSAGQFAYKEAPDPENTSRRIYVYDPGNSGFMVPPPTVAFLAQVGDPSTGVANPFFRFNKTPRGLAQLMQNMAVNLRNPRVLSQLTLGAYGSVLEFTVHNWMHMRWASAQPRDPQTGQPILRSSYDIDARWDAADNDYLGDFHSSHVNPIFWKLHGWVDDCIGAWQNAHDTAHPGQVKPMQVRGIDWYAPGPWVVKKDPFDWPGAGTGHGHHDADGHHGHDEVETLEQVMAILKEVDERPAADTMPAAAQPSRRPNRRLPGFARFVIPDELSE